MCDVQEGKVDLTWYDYLQLFVLGFTGVGVPQTVIFVANKVAGAGLVGILRPLMTAFTALLAGLMGLERVGPLKVRNGLLATAVIHATSLEGHQNAANMC